MSSKPKEKTVVDGYKGFNRTFMCRDMQYQPYEYYHMGGKPRRCERGYHFCTDLRDCFGYYTPSSSRYAAVWTSGKIDRGEDLHLCDTKVATTSLHVEGEIPIEQIVSVIEQQAYDHTNIILDEDCEDPRNMVMKAGPCKVFAKPNCKYSAMAWVGVGAAKYQVVDTRQGSSISAGHSSIAKAGSSHTVAIALARESIALAEGYCRLAATMDENSIAQAENGASVALAMDEGSRAILRCNRSIGVAWERNSSVDALGSFNIIIAEGDVFVTGRNNIVVFPHSARGSSTVKCSKDTLLVFFINPLYTGEIVTMRMGDNGTDPDKTYTLEDLRIVLRGYLRQVDENRERFPLD